MVAGAVCAVAVAALGLLATTGDDEDITTAPPASALAATTPHVVTTAAANVVPSPTATTPATVARTTTTAPRCPEDEAPETGTDVEDPADESGLGKLEVDNGTDRGAQLKVVAAEQGAPTMRHVYIGAHSKFTMTGIPDGEYRVLVLQGKGWNAATGTFGCDGAAREFEKHLEFTTTRTSSTRWTLTLQPVVGGAAKTDPIGVGSFYGAGS
jgi:hypothetical protein